MDKRAVEYEGAEGCNQKAKDKQTGDDSRLVIELLEHAPKGYLFVPKKNNCFFPRLFFRRFWSAFERTVLLQVFRHALSSGHIPTSWQTTISNMLPKSAIAKFASDFRPIANLGLLCNFFRLPYVGSDGG